MELAQDCDRRHALLNLQVPATREIWDSKCGQYEHYRLLELSKELITHPTRQNDRL
jgi:hypothetical protein